MVLGLFHVALIPLGFILLMDLGAMILVLVVASSSSYPRADVVRGGQGGLVAYLMPCLVVCA